MKMRRDFILLDTSLIVALLDKKDSLHKSAIEKIQNASSNKFAILDVILGEAYSVIARRCRERKYDCENAIKVLREFESGMNIIPIQLNDLHDEVIDNLIKDSTLNYNDWVLLIFALKNGLSILTLDKKLEEKLTLSS